MDPKQERCVLEGLLKALDSSKRRPRRWRTWLSSAALWLATATMFLVVFQNAGQLGWPHFLLATGCFALGVYLAYDFYVSMFNQQWPVMAKYVDREQVERRLAELRI